MEIGMIGFFIIICACVAIGETVSNLRAKKLRRENYKASLERAVICQDRALMHYRFNQWQKEIDL